MEKPTRENLKKEFTFDGTRLYQLEYCEKTGRYLYKRVMMNDGRTLGFEIITPRKYNNPDGTIVYVYPSTAEFGYAGWFLPPNAPRTQIDYYLQGINKKMTYVEYLKSLKK